LENFVKPEGRFHLWSIFGGWQGANQADALVGGAEEELPAPHLHQMQSLARAKAETLLQAQVSRAGGEHGAQKQGGACHNEEQYPRQFEQDTEGIQRGCQVGLGRKEESRPKNKQGEQGG
jgi:hypothetical protein